ncbi:hypothetical protein CCACVL1_06625 [Corchorus capsularis]|uniref:Uncharacterized protein n=1 Tax=Corchorus capsularis TaxID=210143 RepID=A0A1R3JE65_COCAP|nr:hypothetical protein CCACVL1_06625 [Corchorus capsularis]
MANVLRLEWWDYFFSEVKEEEMKPSDSPLPQLDTSWAPEKPFVLISIFLPPTGPPLPKTFAACYTTYSKKKKPTLQKFT